MVNDCGNQHIKCYRQNSAHSLHVLFPANRQIHVITATWEKARTEGVFRVEKDHQSKASSRALNHGFYLLNPKSQLFSGDFRLRCHFILNLGAHTIDLKATERQPDSPQLPQLLPGTSSLGTWSTCVDSLSKNSRKTQALLKKIKQHYSD